MNNSPDNRTGERRPELCDQYHEINKYLTDIDKLLSGAGVGWRRLKKIKQANNLYLDLKFRAIVGKEQSAESVILLEAMKALAKFQSKNPEVFNEVELLLGKIVDIKVEIYTTTKAS